MYLSILKGLNEVSGLSGAGRVGFVFGSPRPKPAAKDYYYYY
jgi:hypothetical protein